MMTIEQALQLHYDAFAQEYDGTNQGIDLLLSRLALPANASVLDLGCGTGNLTLRLPEKGKLRRLVGVDLSAAVLDIARNHARELQLERVEFMQANVCDLPFSEGEFDLVVSNMVFHLIPDQERAFAEVVRVLKPSGRAVLQFQGGGDVAAEWMDIFRCAWRSVLPSQEPPTLIQRTTVGTVERHLCGLGMRDFDISWRHRTRRLSVSDVPQAIEFGRIVLGFWRWGLPEDVVERIEEQIARQLTEKAAAGTLVNTVNVLLVEFAKR